MVSINSNAYQTISHQQNSIQIACSRLFSKRKCSTLRCACKMLAKHIHTNMDILSLHGTIVVHVHENILQAKDQHCKIR